MRTMGRPNSNDKPTIHIQEWSSRCCEAEAAATAATADITLLLSPRISPRVFSTAGVALTGNVGCVLGEERSEPQNLHLIAADFICSAQNGQSLNSGLGLS